MYRTGTGEAAGDSDGAEEDNWASGKGAGALRAVTLAAIEAVDCYIQQAR